MTLPLVVFRVDASISMGTGHVMRCLSLAQALRAAGGRCVFVCRAHAGHLTHSIQEQGYEVRQLPLAQQPAPSPSVQAQSSHSGWLGAHWATDAKQTTTALAHEPLADWLVVDHYAIDAEWEATLRPACRRILVIDDLADRPHDCDLLLDQTLGRSAADYADRVPPNCAVLTGPAYALLRPQFANARAASLARRAVPALKHILVSMGGVDADNYTVRVLHAIDQSLWTADGRVTAVLGASAPSIDHVRECAAGLSRATDVVVDTPHMARLMAASDLAIGAAGGTSWERCCVGLPSMLVVAADNQRRIAQALEDAGAAITITPEHLEAQLQEQIARMATDGVLLSTMSRNAALVTDGLGALTIARRLVPTCTLR